MLSEASCAFLISTTLDSKVDQAWKYNVSLISILNFTWICNIENSLVDVSVCSKQPCLTWLSLGHHPRPAYSSWWTTSRYWTLILMCNLRTSSFRRRESMMGRLSLIVVFFSLFSICIFLLVLVIFVLGIVFVLVLLVITYFLVFSLILFAHDFSFMLRSYLHIMPSCKSHIRQFSW